MGPRRRAVRVFISYSHDSAAHRRRVLRLAEWLRNHGVDARLDRYVEGSPDVGWPQWMYDQIEAADFVAVVCTATYARRALKREAPARGLGAAWEGAIISQALYARHGRNNKFIPVFFEADDAASIPYFLQEATRYDVRTVGGRRALSRHLTGQHDTPMPPLGPVPAAGPRGRRRPPAPARPAAPRAPRTRGAAPARVPFAGRDPVLFRFPDGRLTVFGATRVATVVGDTTEVSLVADDPGEAAAIDALGAAGGVWSAFGRQPTVGVAYGSRAYWARVTGVRHERAGGREQWTVTLRPEPAAGVAFDDVTVNGRSPDDVAALRARRILLDEPLPADAPADRTWAGAWGRERPDPYLESLVRGSGLLPVERSPLPALYAGWTGDRASYAVVARLTAVFWLILSRTVEAVTRLDLTVATPRGAPPALRVRFAGTRPQRYTNAPAAALTVEGACPLPPPGGAR